MTHDTDDGFERRARAAFDASVDALDGATRSRLNRARQRALAHALPAADRVPGARWAGWAPAGALAVGVLGAALLLRGPSGGGPDGGLAATPATLTQGTVEMIAAGEEFEIATADEALDFYRWVATNRNGTEGRS